MSRKWTPAKIATLRELCPNTDTHEIAAALGVTHRACMVKACELGVKKRREAKRTWTHHAQLPSTWGFGKDPGKYTRGKPSPNRQPLGSEFVSKKGEVYVKVAMTGRKNADWRRKAHVEWEKHNRRELQPHEVIGFADGNTTNLEADNLLLRTKEEVILSNSIHNLPREIADLHRAKGQIIRAIRRRAK